MTTLLPQNTYSLDFIINYLNTFDIPELDDATINIINKISNEVGAPTYQKTPIFKNNERKKKSKLTTVDWEELRNYKKTEFTKNKGEDADIDFIRSNLNKMSNKTYKDLFPLIKSKIDDMLLVNPDILQKISFIVLNIGSVNIFVGELFCDLYHSLTNIYGNQMNDYLNNYWDDFIDSFNHIEIINPDENYDLFCINNKKNEDRRSKSTFFINLVKKQIFSPEKLGNSISTFITLILQFTKENDKLFMVEELTENVYLMMLNNIPLLKNTIPKDKWNDIFIILGIVTRINPKKNPSMSQKALFKLMDVYDEI